MGRDGDAIQGGNGFARRRPLQLSHFDAGNSKTLAEWLEGRGWTKASNFEDALKKIKDALS